MLGRSVYSIMAVTAMTGGATVYAVAGHSSVAPLVDVAMTIGVTADGTGTFNAADGPGRDAGPHNGIVRTGDAIAYKIDVNALTGTAYGERFTLTAPRGTEWTQ